MVIRSAYDVTFANSSNGYLDAGMRPKPQRPGEFDFFIGEAQKSGGPVLELASGACRMMMVLAEAGIEVFGVEASEAMISIGKKTVVQLPEHIRKRIHVVCGDMRSFAFSKKFPLIIVPFHSFWFNFYRISSSGQRDTAAEAFRQAEACICSITGALASGGRFIIDTPRVPLYILLPEYPIAQSWDIWAEKYGFRYKIVTPYLVPSAEKKDSFVRDIVRGGTEVLIGEKL